MATGIEGAAAGAGAVPAREPRQHTISSRLKTAGPATWLFAAAACVSAGLLLLLGSRLTFFLDDWEFLVYRRGFNADAILAPHGENIAIGPVLVYKALLETAGMASALPFRIVSTAAFIASVTLLYVYLRRRLGDWPALAAGAAVLFLGAAWEDLLWPFQVGYFVSMAAGLGTLLALERHSRRGDLVACALLAVSVLFSSLGLPFAVGAAVLIALGPRASRRRRAFVFVLPLGLFAAWWLGWGREADTEVSWQNVASAPVFMFDGLASSISSLLGLATPRDETAVSSLDWGRPLLVVALLLAGWRLWRLGRVPPALIVATAIAATFWLLAGVNEKPGRDPFSSRYQYVGAIFLLLIAAELLRGVRLKRAALAAVFAVTLLAVASNLSFLVQSWRSYRLTSQIERADLAAVEIARDRVSPGFLLRPEIAGTAYVHIDAASYLSAADAFGSPAYDEAELGAAPEVARNYADVVLANALGVSFSTEANAGTARGCLVAAPPAQGERRLVELPPGGAVIEAPRRSPVLVRMRRFSTENSPVTVGELAAGRTGVLEIPTDRSQRPWLLDIEAGGPTSVCGLPG